MREHPIPQDVTGYKFHIIGNMTLKQFAELGLAVVICVVLYSTNLFFFIKWPLIAIVAGMGFMVAFVPIAERPLDHWIITFIRILYKPTKYFWKREPKIPDAFSYKPPQGQNLNEVELDLTPARQQRVKEFFGSINNNNNVEPWELEEKSRIGLILDSFSSVKVAETEIVTQKIKPNLGVRVRNLKDPNIKNDQFHINSTKDSLSSQNLDQTSESSPTAKKAVKTDEVASQISVPELQTISLEHKHEQDFEEVNNPQNALKSESSFLIHDSSKNPTHNQNNPDVKNVVENISLPFPTKPNEPNKVVGMVLSPDNKILTNAIVEIKDSDEKIVRAVKTNLLGQFFITTALKNGQYFVNVEKDGYNFKPLQVELNGRIIEPIEIRSE